LSGDKKSPKNTFKRGALKRNCTVTHTAAQSSELKARVLIRRTVKQHRFEELAGRRHPLSSAPSARPNCLTANVNSRQAGQVVTLATACVTVQLLFSALFIEGASLVTFLHPQESNPLAAGQRKVCSSMQHNLNRHPLPTLPSPR
jgi:hypothetical protein